MATGGERDIDVGYRAWRGAYWLGRHGTLKGTIADAVTDAGAGLRLDISTRDDDTLNGDDWFRFLTRCRYTIGLEGGASVLDIDGVFKGRTEEYLAEHPDALYDEVEDACFPGEDGRLALFALSPRHLEACATRTCQILVRGGYNGVLEPGRHYIELEPDLSNLESVLATLGDEERRSAITDAAYADVVASGRYTYAAMVEDIERFAGLGSGARLPRGRPRPRGAGRQRRRRPARLADACAYAAPRARTARYRRLRTATALEPARGRGGGAGARIGEATPARRQPVVRTIVSVTPIPVERDSRTFKIASFYSRLGYRSVVVEGAPSRTLSAALPFELVSAGAAAPEATPAPNSPLAAVPPAIRDGDALDGSDPLTGLDALAARTPPWLRSIIGPPWRRLRVSQPAQFLGSLKAYIEMCVDTSRALPPADLYHLHAQLQLPVWWHARRCGVPFIYDAHDLYATMRINTAPLPPAARAMWRIWDVIERQSARRATTCVTVSDGVAAHAQEEFGRPFAVVRNAHDEQLDEDTSIDIRSAAGLDASALVVAVVGNHKPEIIAIDPLIEALTRLPDHVHVVCVGRGYDAVVAGAEELAVTERVHVLPPCARRRSCRSCAPPISCRSSMCRSTPTSATPSRTSSSKASPPACRSFMAAIRRMSGVSVGSTSWAGRWIPSTRTRSRPRSRA